MPAAKAPTEHRPNLAGVISPEDLFKKNGHDYVAWARIANYLHTNANGWECHMRLAPDGSSRLEGTQRHWLSRPVLHRP